MEREREEASKRVSFFLLFVFRWSPRIKKNEVRMNGKNLLLTTTSASTRPSCVAAWIARRLEPPPETKTARRLRGDGGEGESLLEATAIVCRSSRRRHRFLGADAARAAAVPPRRGTAVPARDDDADAVDSLIFVSRRFQRERERERERKREGEVKEREREREQKKDSEEVCSSSVVHSLSSTTKRELRNQLKLSPPSPRLSLFLRVLSFTAMPPPRRARDPDLEASSSEDEDNGTRREEDAAARPGIQLASVSTTAAAALTAASTSSSKGRGVETDELSREWEARRARFHNVREPSIFPS